MKYEDLGKWYKLTHNMLKPGDEFEHEGQTYIFGGYTSEPAVWANVNNVERVAEDFISSIEEVEG